MILTQGLQGVSLHSNLLQNPSFGHVPTLSSTLHGVGKLN